MIYLKVADRVVQLVMMNDRESNHQEILDEVGNLLNHGVNKFEFDFSAVDTYTSHTIGFVLGMVKGIVSKAGTVTLINIRDDGMKKIVQDAGFDPACVLLKD